jgi:hypothetical protein
MKNRFYKFVGVIVLGIIILSTSVVVYAQGTFGTPSASSDTLSAPTSSAPPQNTNGVTNNTENPEYSNLNSSKFRLLICDGPAELIHYNPATRKFDPNHIQEGFIPCDFRGLMMQIQHLINIAMTLGVLIAVAGLLFAGYLYISGTPANISKAHDIFPSLAKGFIIMLAAWFIVYQILAWLTGTNGYGVLLGL